MPDSKDEKGRQRGQGAAAGLQGLARVRQTITDDAQLAPQAQPFEGCGLRLESC